MKITFKYPESFNPDEKEFVYYCGIKLYKEKIINEEEAMKMMGIKDKEIFNNLFIYCEKRFKKLCTIKTTDTDFNE